MMLSKEYKEEAFRRLENLTPDELIRTLKEIGSTWEPEKKQKDAMDNNSKYIFEFSSKDKSNPKGEHVA